MPTYIPTSPLSSAGNYNVEILANDTEAIIMISQTHTQQVASYYGSIIKPADYKY